MRLKLKQQNNHAKHFILPPIRSLLPGRASPRVSYNNRSLPKIPPSITQPNDHLITSKRLAYEKQNIKDKPKSIYKKNHQLHVATEQSLSGCDNEDTNNISTFQRQIEKNLLMLKRERTNHQRGTHVDRARYDSPRAAVYSDSLSRITQKQSRCVTDDDVFHKINQIIAKSQSKPLLLNEEKDITHSSSIIVRDRRTNKAQSKLVSKHMIKTQASEVEKSYYENNSRKKIQFDIKNAGNYQQWRKLSIDSDEPGKVSYAVSSYDIETDRLQKIRSKNDLSLKKYFQGKSYLTRLIKLRDSSALLPRKI